MAASLPANWGNIASALGLLVSAFGLVYAIKAEIAASRAATTAQSAYEAAEAARSEARKRNIADELHDAQRRSQQLGHFLSSKEWRVVQILAQELTASCTQILLRWDVDALTDESRSKLLRIQQQANSIVKASMLAVQSAPDSATFARICSAQQKAYELLSEELAAFSSKIDTVR